MKKILFVINSLKIGGSEKSLLSLLNLLDYCNHIIQKKCLLYLNTYFLYLQCSPLFLLINPYNYKLPFRIHLFHSKNTHYYNDFYYTFLYQIDNILISFSYMQNQKQYLNNQLSIIEILLIMFVHHNYLYLL